jgi:acyl carrier protein
VTASLDEVRRLVAVQLGRRTVAPGDRLVEDLGAESMDLVNLVAATEERYGIEVAEEEISDLRTVADLHRLVAARLGRG